MSISSLLGARHFENKGNIESRFDDSTIHDWVIISIAAEKVEKF